MIKDSIELMSKKQRAIVTERTAIPLKSRLATSIPQLRQNSVKPIIRTKVTTTATAKKSPTVHAPKKQPIIQSPKEYPKGLEELLWTTPVKACEQTTPVVDINYAGIINELNSMCYVSIVPSLHVKKAGLKDEHQMEQMQQKIQSTKSKLHGLYEKNQAQLDMQRALLSYMKINSDEDTRNAITDLCKMNEAIMLIMNEILLLSQHVQQLETQYSEQLTSHLTTLIDEQKQKTLDQECFIQDMFCRLKDVLFTTSCPEQSTKDASHTSTSSSSSSYGSNTSCLSFSSRGTLSSIQSTDGPKRVDPHEKTLQDLIETLRKRMQEKQVCESLLKGHKRSADLNLDLNKTEGGDELRRLRREVEAIKETIFLDVCQERQIKEIIDIKPSIHKHIRRQQETYVARESAFILQSASLESQLQKVCKEHEYLTRNLVDFKLERQKYQQEIKKLKLEKYDYLTELSDYKVIRLNESTLRKEFRQLMKTVKESHKKEMLLEWKKQRDLEQTIKEIKEDGEIKKWDMIDKSVQTHFIL